jgi:hypothetical protein
MNHRSLISSQGGVEELWSTVADLLEPSSPSGVEGKVAALHFMTKLVEDQGQQLNDPMRAIAFRTIVRSYDAEHLSASLSLFSALTDSGRKAGCFETEVGPFLLKMFADAVQGDGAASDFPDAMQSDRIAGFLHVLETFIKFNAAYLDPPLLSAYIG